MSYADTLIGIRWEDLPEPVQAQAKRCLKDIIATAAGSLALPTSAQAGELVDAQFGVGDVPLWFKGAGSSAVGAAFFNALTVDSLDCHDGFRPNKGHAGATVVPVAVGACSHRPVSGAELLTAVVMGYEIACRAGLVVHAMYTPACPSSGSWAALGAAAGGARILGLPADVIDETLGMAEYYAPISPLIRCTTYPSVVKDGAGAGAMSAAMALAMQGREMPGLPSLFTAEAEGAGQAETLGDEWMILRQYFKPYPTCRWTQPVVEGVLALQREHGFTHDEIESIEVETFQEGAELVKFPPEHTDGAQYCTPWAVAAMLVDGQLGIEQIHPDRLGDSQIINLGHRIKTRIADDIQQRFPEECLARVTVTLKDGRELTGPTTGARGDHTNPLSDDEINAKFDELVTQSLGAEKRRELNDVLESLVYRF
jgi:2-methylcitrate dehydratase PrpD